MKTSMKFLLAGAVAIAALAAWACGETVIQTVVVEKEVQVQGETIIQTVEVVREVEVPVTEVQTVVVEKQVQVAGETVVQDSRRRKRDSARGRQRG